MATKRFPPTGPDSGKPFLALNIDKGDQGDPAVVALLYPAAAAVHCESDGSSPVLPETVSAMIVEGNEVLADMSAANGWSVVVDSVVDCTASTWGTIGIQFDTVAADRGYAVLKFSHVDYTDVYARTFYFKAYEGAKGDTGNPGAKGDTGDLGPKGDTGDAGAGMVIEKHPISVKASVSSNFVNYGDGKVRINKVAHGWVLGEWLIFEGSTYDDQAEIIEVISVDAVKVDYAYSSDESSVPVWSMRHFRSLADSDAQILRFDDIFELGDKPWEIWLVMDNQGNGESLFVSAGYLMHPASGYAYWFNNKSFKSIGEIEGATCWDKDAFPNNVVPITLVDDYTHVYLYVEPYPGKTWSADYPAVTFELHLARLDFAVDY